MSLFNVSTRYSKALHNQSEGKGNLARISDNVELMFNTLSGSKELRNLLKSPVINSDKKFQILTELFKGKLEKDTENFLKFIVSKNRTDMLYGILKRFLELRDEQLGIVNVEVSSASGISNTQEIKLKDSLEKFTNKKVKAKYSIDENLIGGFVARIGDTFIDASINNQLKMLKKQLLR